MLIAHLSDTHFGCERPDVVQAALTRLRQLQPEVIIVSGDVTQRARPAEYSRARDFLNQLPGARHVVIPGNHDLPLTNPLARLMSPLGRFKFAFGRELTPVVDTPEALIVTVNTTRPWRHKNGEVSQAQIDGVCRCLNTGPAGRLRIVVAHHPAAVVREQDAPNQLRNAPAALAAWRAAGCDLVLGGHIHLPYILSWPQEARFAAGGEAPATPVHEGNPAATPGRDTPHGGGLESPLWVVQAGTAVSRRVRHEAANSFNMIRTLPPRERERWCVVERWDHRPGRGFCMALSKPLTLADRGPRRAQDAASAA